MKIKLLAVNVGLIAVSVYVKRNYILYIEITYIFHIMEFVIACIIKFSEGKIQKIDVRVVKIDVQEKIVRQYYIKIVIIYIGNMQRKVRCSKNLQI